MDARELFSRIPAHLFIPWLDQEKADAIRHLAEASDPIGIYRAQGRLALLEKMRKLVEAKQ